MSGRAIAAGVGKEVAGAGVMGFVRSGVRPGASGMLIASEILDYLPTPVTVFISKMCLAPEWGGLLCCDYEIPPQTPDKSPGPKLLAVCREELEDMGRYMGLSCSWHLADSLCVFVHRDLNSYAHAHTSEAEGKQPFPSLSCSWWVLHPSCTGLYSVQ